MEEKDKITFVTDCDEGYPERLRNMEDRPRTLYFRGDLPEDDVPAVAIIGARNCSPYGEYTASEFGAYLARQGVNIISGMARGIDGISQKGALEGGGKTFAVLGSGVDVCYPASNRALYGEILQNGGILSIFPPGSAPEPFHFLQRNAIVSALADIVLVIEARASSGTCNTVEHALRQGREIYAVPGRITDRLSDGCNILLRQGAGVALSPEDLYKELMILWNRKTAGEILPKRTSEESSRIIRKMKEARGMLEGTKPEPERKRKKADTLTDMVDITARSAEEIYRRWKKHHKEATLQETTKELILLCLKGDISQIGSGYYYKKI